MNFEQQFDKIWAYGGGEPEDFCAGAKIANLYTFYRFFGASEDKITDVEDSMVGVQVGNFLILRNIVRDAEMEGQVADFVFVVEPSQFGFFLATLDDNLKLIAKAIEDIYYDRDIPNIRTAKNAFFGLGFDGNEERILIARVLCPVSVSTDIEKEVKAKAGAISLLNGLGSVSVCFAEDIEQEISDIEDPDFYVSEGSLLLYKGTKPCVFDEGGSFLGVVSARSLQELYNNYSNKGLFAANLRFFVSYKKIDPKIRASIRESPEKFVYFNNGIIITCKDFSIDANGLVTLRDFSIVNGCQTTTLIGTTGFEKDFPVVAKIIKNNGSSEEERTAFLADVAEASNSQKPINAKDLIANRVEQRNLKNQFKNAGIFLKVKRGEKINKEQYPEAWMNASNDEVAQMIYASVYQHPGSAKNSKSSLLSNDHTYAKIFKTSYVTPFFVSLQRIKTDFAYYVKTLKKTEPHNSARAGISRHANLLVLAVIGLIIKIATVKGITDYLIRSIQIPNYVDDDGFRDLISQNDIGQSSLLRLENGNPLDFSKGSMQFAFDDLLDNVLLPAYSSFKSDYPTLAYSHFAKSDSYYYRYVVPKIIGYCLKNPPQNNPKLKAFLNFNLNDAKPADPLANFMDYKPGLMAELDEYCSKKSPNGDGRSQILTRSQISNVCLHYPRNLTELRLKANFAQEQIEKYGKDILMIVGKYVPQGDGK